MQVNSQTANALLEFITGQKFQGIKEQEKRRVAEPFRIVFTGHQTTGDSAEDLSDDSQGVSLMTAYSSTQRQQGAIARDKVPGVGQRLARCRRGPLRIKRLACDVAFPYYSPCNLAGREIYDDVMGTCATRRAR